jgi:hypothetical protein
MLIAQMIAADLALANGRLKQITPAGIAVRLWLIATAAITLFMS